MHLCVFHPRSSFKKYSSRSITPLTWPTDGLWTMVCESNCRRRVQLCLGESGRVKQGKDACSGSEGWLGIFWMGKRKNRVFHWGQDCADPQNINKCGSLGHWRGWGVSHCVTGLTCDVDWAGFEPWDGETSQDQTTMGLECHVHRSVLRARGSYEGVKLVTRIALALVWRTAWTGTPGDTIINRRKQEVWELQLSQHNQ